MTETKDKRQSKNEEKKDLEPKAKKPLRRPRLRQAQSEMKR
ncbi:MAG: hypothetical protein P1V97_10205 [Planctomycetota bacterium]|nr:hypothetical protein [Planctomycetota bacterium]